MPQSLQSFIVSIRHQTHRAQIVGTGFVVDTRHLLTCAHVITQAGAAPGDTVRVVFAVPREAGRNQPSAKAVVLPDFWRDPAGDDVAVLRGVRWSHNKRSAISKFSQNNTGVVRAG